jgi:hypothetical protein
MPGRSDLVIVVLPQDESDGTFSVCLMQSDGAGGINWKSDDGFIVVRTQTLESAVDYAKGLADILLFEVLQIAPT